MHHDSCLVVCTKKSIKGFLILNTTLTIVDNYLSLHACWLNILTEVIDDIFTYVVNTLISSEECFYTSPANKFILILFADMVGKRIKLFLKLGFIHVHFDRDSLEVQFKCSTVGNRVLEGVFRDIAIFIFFCTKASKGVVVITIDRCTCQSEEECIWKCSSHLLTKISFLCTMRLVHKENDVISFINNLSISQISELKDGRNQDLTLMYFVFKFLL